MQKKKRGKDLPGREQILLVDDDAVFREEFVECFSGYRFTLAACAEEALAILKKPNEIDLVIMDVKMPGMDGLALLEKIKELAPGTSTIIETAYGSKEVLLKVLRGKADDYIEKPFDIEKTRGVIENVLNGRKGGYSNSTAGTEDKIAHVKLFLSRNASRKVSLKDAAAAVCLNPKYLSRLFQEHAGVGFNEYRLRLKLQEAKALLTGTGCNVDQVSDKLGYQNTGSFIRQFKKLSGLTPAGYRKKHRGRRP
ncbi:MAG TPA: hypothetical protein DCZ92_05420 [Elusimicrobia bacterium]|nr:MAG: hypothetical protein A2016_12515 [Elusimicrobia bacterium GWF2_62_30]HBA60245.1 hypothetical protein [Elusimicrobiota bacterium]